jgi:hypothetical protein
MYVLYGVRAEDGVLRTVSTVQSRPYIRGMSSTLQYRRPRYFWFLYIHTHPVFWSGASAIILLRLGRGPARGSSKHVPTGMYRKYRTEHGRNRRTVLNSAGTESTVPTYQPYCKQFLPSSAQRRRWSSAGAETASSLMKLVGYLPPLAVVVEGGGGAKDCSPDRDDWGVEVVKPGAVD